MTELPDDWDEVRLRDLDPLGWAFILAASVAFVFMGVELLTILEGGSITGVLLFALVGGAFLWFADQTVRPEVEGECAHCGYDVEVNSGAPTPDTAVIVHHADPPDRLGEGPISTVRERRSRTYLYCSPGCALADTESDEPPAGPAPSAASPEVSD